MKRYSTWMGLVALAAVVFACGARVVVDTGAGGHGGQDAGVANTCPTGPQDAEIKNLVGLPCPTPEQVCASNDVCSGCSITCANGFWTATSAQLCFQAGPTC